MTPDEEARETLKKEFQAWWDKWRKMSWELEYPEDGIISKEDAWELYGQAALEREKRLQEIAEIAGILLDYEGVFSLAARNRIKEISRLVKGEKR